MLNNKCDLTTMVSILNEILNLPAGTLEIDYLLGDDRQMNTDLYTVGAPAGDTLTTLIEWDDEITFFTRVRGKVPRQQRTTIKIKDIIDIRYIYTKNSKAVHP